MSATTFYQAANQVQSARSGWRPYYPPRPRVVVLQVRPHVLSEGENPYTIAQDLFGDETLWYLVAEANPPRDPMGWATGEVLLVPEVLAQ